MPFQPAGAANGGALIKALESPAAFQYDVPIQACGTVCSSSVQHTTSTNEDQFRCINPDLI